MQTEKYKKYIIISMVIALLFLCIEVMLFWNAFVAEKPFPVILPFLCVILIILALGYSLNLTLKATNLTTINAHIENEIARERARLVKEFEQKDEKEQVIDQNEIIVSKVSEIIPKGNFKNIDSLLEKYLKNLANAIEIVQGIIYTKSEKSEEFKFASGFALTNDKKIPGFKLGESLPGQVVLNAETAYINDIPEKYFFIESGLGKASPRQLVFAPVTINNTVVALLELAFFKQIEGISKEILQQSLKEISLKVEQTIKS